MSVRGSAQGRHVRAQAPPAAGVPLDRAERHVLADLQDDLQRADPSLAASLTGLNVPSPVRWWLGTIAAVVVTVLALRLGGTRALGMLALVVVPTAPLLVCLAVPSNDGPAEDPRPS